jgi:DNA polymerase phi
MAAEGFILLYALTLMQVYNGEGDAVMMLDDLDASRKAMSKKGKDATAGGTDPFVEVVLSFLGNPRTLFRRIGEEAFSIFAAEIGTEGLRSLTDILDTEENLEGQKELFNQGGEDAEEEGDSSDDSEDDSDVEMIDGGEGGSGDEGPDASDSDASNGDDGESDEDESEDEAEVTQFDNMLAMTLQTSKPNATGDAAGEESEESDMDDEQMLALDPHLSHIFKQRSQVTKKKDREDAKQNMVSFKSRVLDLLTIYLDKQYSNPLTLEILLPVIRRTRASANKQLADKALKLLKAHFAIRTKHKAPLPKPEDADSVWELLKDIHEEAKLGGGAKMHADTCSSASLHIAKVLVGLDKENYAGVVDVYAETQKQWFMDKASPLQPVLFTSFQNWSLTARQQSK